MLTSNINRLDYIAVYEFSYDQKNKFKDLYEINKCQQFIYPLFFKWFMYYHERLYLDSLKIVVLILDFASREKKKENRDKSYQYV